MCIKILGSLKWSVSDKINVELEVVLHKALCFKTSCRKHVNYTMQHFGKHVTVLPQSLQKLKSVLLYAMTPAMWQQIFKHCLV